MRHRFAGTASAATELNVGGSNGTDKGAVLQLLRSRVCGGAGDRVRAVIIGMDEDYSRLSISTKDLEVTPGDMLINKQAVFETAEEGVKPFLQHVADWEAENAAKQAEQDWHDGTPDTMEGEDFRR